MSLLPVPPREHLLSTLPRGCEDPQESDVSDLHQAASLAWGLSDDTLRALWRQLAEQYGITQSFFISKMCVNQGNFLRYLNGKISSNFVKDRTPPLYSGNEHRKSIVAWLILAWCDGHPADLVAFRQSVSDYCCGVTDGINFDVLLNPNSSPPIAYTCEPVVTIQISPLNNPDVVTPEIGNERLIAHYHRIVTSDLFRLILFVDCDNNGSICRALQHFIPPDSSSILVVGFMNSKTIAACKHPPRPWLIDIGVGAQIKNAADVVLSMEVRSCIDYLIWNGETLRASRRSPIHVIMVSEDRIFSLVAHVTSSLLKQHRLSEAVICQQWNARAYSLPLCLMLLLPDIPWNPELSAIVALCREIRESSPSRDPLSNLGLLTIRLSAASSLPYFVVGELFHQRAAVGYDPSSPTGISPHDLAVIKNCLTKRALPERLQSLVKHLPILSSSLTERYCNWQKVFADPAVSSALGVVLYHESPLSGNLVVAWRDASQQ